MFQPRTLALLSTAERQLLRQPTPKSTHCLRCFHTSRPSRSDENPSKPAPSNDTGTPYNTPNRAPTRQQRAAQASSEVSALAADLPTSNLAGRNAEHQGPQQREPSVTPQARGENTRPGAMGETEGPGKEGPFAQGVGRLARAEEEDPTVGKPGRRVRTPAEAVEEPFEGGAGTMEPLNHGGQQSATQPGETAETSQPTSGTVEAPPTTPTSTRDAALHTTQKQTPTKKSLSAEDYLHLGQNGHTILSSNFSGVLHDRINLVAPSAGPSHSSIRAFEHRLITRGSELASTTPSQASLIRDETVQGREEQAKEKGMDQRPMKGRPRFATLRKETQEGVVDRLVRGKYDPQGLLGGAQVHKQPLLNEVAKLTLKNSTYLASDGERLLKKVRTLLPSAAAPASNGGKKQQATKK